MHPIHDVDAILLLATALSSKRRPAELVEIMAAVELIHEAIPSEAKLADAFARLSTHALLSQSCEGSDGFSLTPDAQQIVKGLPRKADTAERIFSIREKLSAYTAAAECAPIILSVEQFKAAIAAHKASGQGAGKNLLVPKPKPVETDKHRPGQRQRKPMPAGRRKF